MSKNIKVHFRTKYLKNLASNKRRNGISYLELQQIKMQFIINLEL